MRKILMFSLLSCMAGPLAGCDSMMQSVGLEGPPVPTTPDTPVFFQPWSANLDQPALTTIATAAKAANELPNAPILVTGAADTVGGSKSNMFLSHARAQVVADQLAADGVAASRITTRAVGETRAPGQPGGYQQFSRRVLIRIAAQ